MCQRRDDSMALGVGVGLALLSLVLWLADHIGW